MGDEFGDDESFWEGVDVDALVANSLSQPNHATSSPYFATTAASTAPAPRPDHFAPEAEVERRYAAIPGSIRTELLPHQVEGVKFMLRCGGRALLADAMGLGKSLQAIAAASAYRDEWPLLVVCPAGLRGNWKAEFTRWLPPAWLAPTASGNPFAPPTKGSGKRKRKDDAGAAMRLVETASDLEQSFAPITLVSYDLIAKAGGSDQLDRVGVVICDESHALKSRDTGRTKALTPILAAAQRAMLLSGTPALSRPAELFPQIHALRPELFPSWDRYVERYCGGQVDQWGGAAGSSNEAELRQRLLSTLMIKREKDLILRSLPPKCRHLHYLGPCSTLEAHWETALRIASVAH